MTESWRIDRDESIRRSIQDRIIPGQVPARFRLQALPEFRLGPHNVQADDACRRFGTGGEPGNIILIGPAGTGKSHLGYRAAQERALKAGTDLRCVSVPRFLIKLRDGFGRGEGEETALQSLAAAPVLLLDDLGAEKMTDWTREFLFCVIDDRWARDQAGLIITSNLPMSTLAEMIGPRTVSRIAGFCLVLKIGGPDNRIGTKTKED